MPRQDAVRNRARLVAAAREVFAERGLAATLDDVAERAGVGTGTAYRHFRNKQELAAEVLGDATEQIAIDATDALTIEDPWDALVTFLQTTAQRQAADRGLYQALAGLGRAEDKVRHWPAILEATTTLFARARDAGVVRRDAEPGDAVVVLAMLGAAYDLPAAADGPPWHRYLALLLDGLRAADRPPLPVPAPTYSTLDDVIATSKGRPPVGAGSTVEPEPTPAPSAQGASVATDDGVVAAGFRSAAHGNSEIAAQSAKATAAQPTSPLRGGG